MLQTIFTEVVMGFHKVVWNPKEIIDDRNVQSLELAI